MLLTGADIRRRLFDRAKDPGEWLIISPILNIELQLRDKDASIDLRLASRFEVPTREQLESLDPLAPEYAVRKERYMNRVYVPIGDSFVLHPRQFALAQTLEWVKLPRNIGGYVVGKSSWGREGLIVATATGVHPGWAGPLTLELTNLGEIPLLLYPGLAYVQLFLHEASTGTTAADSPHARQFIGTTKPTEEPRKQKELTILRNWSKEDEEVTPGTKAGTAPTTT